MIPVLTPDEVRAVDAEAPEPVEVLVERAGAAVARSALDLLGGAYGRRVVVVAGRGNNGADGRVAAERLRRRGVRVEVVAVDAAPERLPRCDLVVDAAFGTGFHGSWDAPSTDGAPVLAVDIVSGIDATTGEAAGRTFDAARTVTFQALKPGHVFADGAVRSGTIEVHDIGLDASCARAHVVEDRDVVLPERERETHKWRSAVWVIAGSPGMTGAAELATRAAQRAGAGYVRLSIPGGEPDPPTEAVGTPLPETDWQLEDVDRFGALVVGPGLGRSSDADVRRLVAEASVPVVVDGDGLTAIAGDLRVAPTAVLTPHDGEYGRLTGEKPGGDRLDAARRLAERAGCVVLLKGSTTVVADPAGTALVTVAGGPRLATAGSGDVLSGVIAALLAQGVPALEAAAWGAHLHGRAAAAGPPRGLVAGDLPDLLLAAIADLEA